MTRRVQWWEMTELLALVVIFVVWACVQSI